MKETVIFGAGGMGREAYWIANSLGENVASFIDLEEKDDIYNVPVKTDKFFDTRKHRAVVAIGSPALRQKIVNELDPATEFETLIHPNVILSRDIKLGIGSLICPGVIITVNVKIGDFAQINLGVSISHDCVIGNYLTMGPGTRLAGTVKCGDNVFFGINSSTVEKISITDNVIIGAGACVIKSINQSGTYVGLPAKLTSNNGVI